VTEARTLQSQLGVHDRAKVNDYLEHVREIERRIQRAESAGRVDVTFDKPLGIPDSFDAHTALMTDLLVVAFQADLSRVFTFMMSRELSQRTFPQLEINDPWHVVSHHGNRPEKVANNAKVNVLCLQMFARFLEKLQSTPDGDGSLLDHSLFLYGAGLSNPNLHAHYDLPLAMVGGAAGRMKGGRHLVFPAETPMTNLLLTMLDKVGVQAEKLGDSTGKLPIEPLSGV
jgi:hypothetical protein